MASIELPPDQKERLQSVAAGLLEIYEMLVKLQYLYSILPYIDVKEAGNIDFFQGSRFADFRDAEDVEQGRDPFYCDPEDPSFDDPYGQYMRPWQTPLSLLGNHGSVIVYDAREHRIWIIDQELWTSSDRAFRQLGAAHDNPRTSLNENDFSHIPSRPASDVLRDILSDYRNLEVMPGGGDESMAEWVVWDTDLPELYRQHGWPDHFDGDAFETDLARCCCIERARYIADEVLRKVEEAKWSAGLFAAPVDEEAEFARHAAQTEDEAWVVRYRALRLRQQHVRTMEILSREQERADRLCPEGVGMAEADLPLWLLLIVQEMLEEKVDEVARRRADQLSGDVAQAKGKAQLRRAEHVVAVYKRVEARAAEEAARLCPGRTVAEVRQVRAQREQVTDAELQALEEKEKEALRREIAQIEQWVAALPAGMTQAQATAEEDLRSRRERLRDGQEI